MNTEELNELVDASFLRDDVKQALLKRISGGESEEVLYSALTTALINESRSLLEAAGDTLKDFNSGLDEVQTRYAERENSLLADTQKKLTSVGEDDLGARSAIWDAYYSKHATYKHEIIKAIEQLSLKIVSKDLDLL